jgi:hypothetical protein
VPPTYRLRSRFLAELGDIWIGFLASACGLALTLDLPVRRNELPFPIRWGSAAFPQEGTGTLALVLPGESGFRNSLRLSPSNKGYAPRENRPGGDWSDLTTSGIARPELAVAYRRPGPLQLSRHGRRPVRISKFFWRDGRAVEGARLESVCRETYRGFESHSLRQVGTSVGDRRVHNRGPARTASTHRV